MASRSKSWEEDPFGRAARLLPPNPDENDPIRQSVVGSGVKG
jgi:hypothetical protein